MSAEPTAQALVIRPLTDEEWLLQQPEQALVAVRYALRHLCCCSRTSQVVPGKHAAYCPYRKRLKP